MTSLIFKMSKDNKVYTIFIAILHILVIFILIFIAFLVVEEKIYKKNEKPTTSESVDNLNNDNVEDIPATLIVEKVWRIMEVERNGKKDWIPVLVDDDEWTKA